MTGDDLKEWRKAHMKMKQRDMAMMFGVGYRTYQRWERLDLVPATVQLSCVALWQKNVLGDMPWKRKRS